MRNVQRRAALGYFCGAAMLVAPALALGRQTETGVRIPGAPVFIKLPPIVLPVIEGNAVTRQVGLSVVLELVDGKSLDDIRPHERQLLDAFITELYRIYGWRSTAEHVVNDAMIKQHLQSVADRILGAGVVRAILIVQLLEQDR